MHLPRAGTALALALVVSAGGVACGGDEGRAPASKAPAQPAARPSATPGQHAKRPEASRGETGASAKNRSPGAKRSYDPNRPDRPGNDKPPPAGSPAARFEQRCKKNPGQCD